MKNGVKLIKSKEDRSTDREFIKYTADTVREKYSLILKQSSFLYQLSDGSQARKTSKETNSFYSQHIEMDILNIW